MDLSFYRGRRVFITGHNGFKGAWMCRVLESLGASVMGYSLPSGGGMNLSDILELDSAIPHADADIRDLGRLSSELSGFRPEIVIHMAAQPIVRESYRDPVNTYDINVMGTVNLMESVRRCDSVVSVVNVTTDKVYRNCEKEQGYKEDEFLDGYEPYANSKSCSELVTASYKRSFFRDRDISVTTCRAGNVIGGGDYAKDRIIPDCVRAATDGTPITVRNPKSVRPYQHVLEPVCAYLMIAERQFGRKDLEGCYNIGPDDSDTVRTEELVRIFCDTWPGSCWESRENPDSPHESNILKLDCSKVKKTFGWSPKWNVTDAVEKTVEWHMAYNAGECMRDRTASQIEEYLK